MVAEQYNKREPWDIFAIDEQGRPTTYLSYMILKITFCESNRWFTSDELSKILSAKYTDVDMICRQLKLADLLSEDPLERSRYHYNLKCTNVDVQAGFEKLLADVEIENLPVHLMLGYCPSFPSRRYLQGY
jgi:hypothetical protein